MNDSNIKIHKEKINPFLLVMLTLFIVIVVGSILLFFDYAFKHGWSNLSFEDYINSFLISVSATCVTGLTSYKDGILNAYSRFGQTVIMILIQIGGLGFLTVLAFLITLFAGKLKFKDRHFISQIVGSNSVAHVGKFVKKIILISFVCELLGFLAGLPVFFNLYPNDVSTALFTSLFHSVSSFNNAGFDILGSTSLIANEATSILYNQPIWVTTYLEILTMILIILGGLGFLVIAEIFTFKKPKQWSAFTKIVLSTTAFLLGTGFILFVATECFKGESSMTPLQALFQSVTCRTAGFATYDQANLSMGGKVISSILMFVGGSPLSTAGGIKTTTIFMIILAMFSYLRGKRVAAFKRVFSSKQVIRAMSLAFISLFAILICYCGIYLIEDSVLTNEVPTGDIFFEVFSAFGTTGLSANLTPDLHWGSKLILCILMFLGRLGPMTLFSIFSKNIDKEDDSHFKYVQSDILIG